MARFPTRTLVLMTLALFAFAWFWWRTHQASSADQSAGAIARQPAKDTKDNSPVPVMVLMDGGL